MKKPPLRLQRKQKISRLYRQVLAGGKSLADCRKIIQETPLEKPLSAEEVWRKVPRHGQTQEQARELAALIKRLLEKRETIRKFMKKDPKKLFRLAFRTTWPYPKPPQLLMDGLGIHFVVAKKLALKLGLLSMEEKNLTGQTGEFPFTIPELRGLVSLITPEKKILADVKYTRIHEGEHIFHRTSQILRERSPELNRVKGEFLAMLAEKRFNKAHLWDVGRQSFGEGKFGKYFQLRERVHEIETRLYWLRIKKTPDILISEAKESLAKAAVNLTFENERLGGDADQQIESRLKHIWQTVEKNLDAIKKVVLMVEDGDNWIIIDAPDYKPRIPFDELVNIVASTPFERLWKRLPGLAEKYQKSKIA